MKGKNTASGGMLYTSASQVRVPVYRKSTSIEPGPAHLALPQSERGPGIHATVWLDPACPDRDQNVTLNVRFVVPPDAG
jgi:hypothetical protein